VEASYGGGQGPEGAVTPYKDAMERNNTIIIIIIIIKGKGKFHPRTGHEGPEVE
jgi:hypothetical protein